MNAGADDSSQPDTSARPSCAPDPSRGLQPARDHENETVPLGPRDVAQSKTGDSGCGHPTEQEQARDAKTRLRAIWRVLETVTDPEIPVINVVEMGIIADVRVDDDRCVVEMTPTFAGCPALDVIRDDIRVAVIGTGEQTVAVKVVYDPPWTSDRISETGRRKLREFGLAPPGPSCAGGSSVPNLERTPCPHCGSTNTRLESLFGPTLCRSIHYCDDCLQAFEHFKAV